jgi:homoserine kinase type II
VTAEGRYTLTILPQDSLLDGYYYQHWLLLALAHFNLSFMIPTPLRDRKGATFHRCSTGEQWVIAPCLEGQAIVPNDLDNAYSMGAALAELHHALEQIPPMPRPDVSPYTLHNRVLPNLHKPMPHEPAQLGLSMSKESQHRLRRFVVQAKNYQESLPMPGQDLRWHITHGSFSGYNLRYNGERVVGVEDFSEAHPDYRALEFASALLWVASDLGPMFWGTARAFVEGYAAFVRLTRAEIDLIPRLIVAMQVDRVLSFVGASPQQATSALRAHEDISAWLESEQPRLEAMLRGVFLGE